MENIHFHFVKIRFQFGSRNIWHREKWNSNDFCKFISHYLVYALPQNCVWDFFSLFVQEEEENTQSFDTITTWMWTIICFCVRERKFLSSFHHTNVVYTTESVSVCACLLPHRARVCLCVFSRKQNRRNAPTWNYTVSFLVQNTFRVNLFMLYSTSTSMCVAKARACVSVFVVTVRISPPASQPAIQHMRTGTIPM